MKKWPILRRKRIPDQCWCGLDPRNMTVTQTYSESIHLFLIHSRRVQSPCRIWFEQQDREKHSTYFLALQQLLMDCEHIRTRMRVPESSLNGKTERFAPVISFTCSSP